MYKTSRELKQKALESLKGSWGTIVLMNIIISAFATPFAFWAQNDAAGSLISIIINMLSVIISVGYTSFLLKICCGQKAQANIKDLFYGFKCHPGKAICFYLLTMLYLIPGTIIYAILLVVFMVAVIAGNSGALEAILYSNVASADLFNIDPSFLVGFLGIFILLTILYFIYAVYIETTYGLVYLLLLDYPDLSTNQIWKRSAQLMKGNKWRRIKLDLSFMPAITLASVAVIALVMVPIVNIIAFIIFFVVIFAISIHMSTAGVEFYLDLMQHQPYPTQKVITPVQMTMDYTEVVSDDNLTHDCEETHGNSFEKTDNDYSGIDMNSFK